MESFKSLKYQLQCAVVERDALKDENRVLREEMAFLKSQSVNTVTNITQEPMISEVWTQTDWWANEPKSSPNDRVLWPTRGLPEGSDKDDTKPSQNASVQTVDTEQSLRPHWVCTFCAQQGHRQQECPNPKNPACYLCGNQGYTSTNCPDCCVKFP